MKKTNRFIVLFLMSLLLFLPPSYATSDLETTSQTDDYVTDPVKINKLKEYQNPKLKFKIKFPSVEENLRYTLENVNTNSIVLSGQSQGSNININIKPSEVELQALNLDPTNINNVQYLDYALRVFDKDGQMASHYFSIPLIKNINKVKMSKFMNLSEQMETILNQEIGLDLEPTNNVLTDSNVISPQAYCVKYEEYVRQTDVGFINSVSGLTNTFKFTTGSDVQLDVMKKVGTSWSSGGSFTKSSVTTTTHSLNPPYDQGRKARDNFRYQRRSCVDEVTGASWEEIIPITHIGSYGWGTTISPGGNGAPSSSVKAGSYGDWFRVTPTNFTDKSSKNGTRYTAAATYPVGSISVSIGLTTYYYSESNYSFRSSDGRNYLVYDRSTGGKFWYATRE